MSTTRPSSPYTLRSTWHDTRPEAAEITRVLSAQVKAVPLGSVRLRLPSIRAATLGVDDPGRAPPRRPLVAPAEVGEVDRLDSKAVGVVDEAPPVAASAVLVNGFIVDDDQGRRYFRRTQSGGWQERLHTDEATTVGQPQSQAGWSYRVQEALNQPPDVMAFGPAGQKVRLTTLNPQFDAASWGVMKPYAWRDVQGREWTGGLLEPAAGQRRGKMPLVIQAYVHSPDKFYLDGPNAATGFTSAYPGRAFVREGVLVLAMSYIPKSGGLAGDSAERLRRFNEEVRGAIDALVSEGRVDPERVGIIGFSTTGEMVLNLVTFSDVLLRAATIADGDANTLFSYAVTHGSETWQRMEQLNLGLPVGATRSNWLSNDPALNTDCVRSALRIESYGVPVYANYDVYALLRRQYKPVEMVLIPGGAHSLSKPSERMISLQGNVDWYRFWLKGEERADPALVGETPASLKKQYVDWRQMKKMKADNDAKPRCEREPSRG